MLKTITILLAVTSTVASIYSEGIFGWKLIDFAWPSEQMKIEASARNEYIPINNAIAGIKVWKGKIYLTVPRWKAGIPVTLAVTSAEQVTGSYGRYNWKQELEPYPTWEMQAVGNCNAFQLVQSMEIDPKGRMWVLDTGRTATMTTQPKQNCPPRLVILDLENNGEILRSYQFPADVTPYNSTYLNDIVLDSTDGGFAYITDASRDDPGIIVYSLKDNESWKVRDDSMRAQSNRWFFMEEHKFLNAPSSIHSIALSPLDAKKRLVYYSTLASLDLYAVPTAVLKNKTRNIHKFVQYFGTKRSATDGMAMSATGVLFLALVAEDGVAMWDTEKHPSITSEERLISSDHRGMRWPHTFGFDEKGQLWFVANALQNYMLDNIDSNEFNYQVLKVSTNTKNYQYHEDGSEPELPIIPLLLKEVSSLLAQLDSVSENLRKLSSVFLASRKILFNSHIFMKKS